MLGMGRDSGFQGVLFFLEVVVGGKRRKNCLLVCKYSYLRKWDG